MMKKKANLRDVARVSGVSVTTVSRVINSSTQVSESTREAVEAAMESLHFVPSAAARAVNFGRTYVVGALIPTLDNAVFANFLEALEARLSAHRFSLVVSITDGDPEIEEEKAKALVNIGAEALVVSGVTHSQGFDELISRTRIPTVATSFFDADYRYPTIGYDNAAASKMALEFLLEKGHKQIAVLHGPTDHHDRMRARLSALNSFGHLHDFETDLTLAGAGKAIDALLSSARQVTAVLCLSDVLALGALFQLQRRKIQVPNEIALMGIDGLTAPASTFPTITTIQLPAKEMGTCAAEAVADWVESGIIPEPQLIGSYLIERESV
ncbi:MAG: LacI family DNA-binding transcriptional regulator [Pseudomonadota bacterium]